MSGGSGFYNKYTYAGGNIDKFDNDWPPDDGFYVFSITSGSSKVTDPAKDLYGTSAGPTPTHAVVHAKGIDYYNFDEKKHTFSEGLQLTKEDLIEGAKSHDRVVVFDEEDMPKQLGGSSVDYLPASEGGTDKGTKDGSKDKKKESGMPGRALGALAVGAVYLLTRKKGA